MKPPKYAVPRNPMSVVENPSWSARRGNSVWNSPVPAISRPAQISTVTIDRVLLKFEGIVESRFF